VCVSQFQYVYYDCLYVSLSKLSTWQDQSHISVTPTVHIQATLTLTQHSKHYLKLVLLHNRAMITSDHYFIWLKIQDKDGRKGP